MPAAWAAVRSISEVLSSWAENMPIIYYTATTANGFLADTDNSLAWLFAVPGAQPDMRPFLDSVTALVLGANTYEWLLKHENLLDFPEKWETFFGHRPMFVFAHRHLDAPAGADVRFLSGHVTDHLDAILLAAGGGTVWVQGGGDLAGQFLDAGALDDIVLSIAPVFLAEGKPLLPRELLSTRLKLVSAEVVGQFVHVHYAIDQHARPAGAGHGVRRVE